MVPQPSIPWHPREGQREEDDDQDMDSTMSSQGKYDALLSHLDKMQKNILAELHSSEERLAAKLACHTVVRPFSRVASAGRVTAMATSSDATFRNDYSFLDRDGPLSSGATSFGVSEWGPEVADFVCKMQSRDIDDEDNNRLSMARAMTQDPTPSEAYARTRSHIAQRWAKRIMSQSQMEYFLGILILANGVLIGIETEFGAHDLSENYPKEFFYADLFFAMVFVAEILLRLVSEGVQRFYCKSDQRAWAYVDTFIVAASLLQLGLDFQMRILDTDLIASRGATSLQALRSIRLLRLVRIFRFTQLMIFAQALRTMVHQLLSTLKSLFWAVLLLMMIIYLFAILFTQAVTSHAHDVMKDGAALEETQSLLQHWSSISVSMLSLYMHMVQQRETLVKRLETLFSEIDTDQPGTITLSEFQEHLTDARVQAYFESLELDSSDVWTGASAGTGIDLQEFVTGAMKLRGAAKCVDLVKLTNDHSWMIKKMTRFVKRTDDVLKELLLNSSSVAVLCAAPNIEAQN